MITKQTRVTDTKGIAGARVWLAPGRYVLTELSDLAYEIRADKGTDTEGLAETLLISQVVAYRRTGALIIEGQWPRALSRRSGGQEPAEPR